MFAAVVLSARYFQGKHRRQENLGEVCRRFLRSSQMCRIYRKLAAETVPEPTKIGICAVQGHFSTHNPAAGSEPRLDELIVSLCLDQQALGLTYGQEPFAANFTELSLGIFGGFLLRQHTCLQVSLPTDASLRCRSQSLISQKFRLGRLKSENGPHGTTGRGPPAFLLPYQGQHWLLQSPIRVSWS